MRKVITGAMVSLDGVMQAPGGPNEDPTRDFKLGGWVVPYMDEVFAQAIHEMFAQPFELLLGRKTYEIFAAHWPYAEAANMISSRSGSTASPNTSRQARPWS
jgi:dihydrofolate reductase